MPLIIIAVLTFFGTAFLGVQNANVNRPPLLNSPGFVGGSQICLDEQTAQNGISTNGINVPESLPQIKKATRDTVRNPGFELNICQTGGCVGADKDDYVLVATNVKVDPVFHEHDEATRRRYGIPAGKSDIQLVRQDDFTDDSALQSRLFGRTFRTFCGDWCCNGTNGCRLIGEDAPGPLPYRGSFHCDFLFYMQDTNERGEPQLNPDGTIKNPLPEDPTLPQNGTFFSVYFRKGATIPEKVMCTTTTPIGAQSPEDRQADIQAENNNNAGLSWDNKEWLFKQNSTVKNKETNINAAPYRNSSGSNVVRYPANDQGVEYEVFKNLVNPESNDILYLVPRGEYDRAMEPLRGVPTPTDLPPGTPTPTPELLTYIPVNYKEFHALGTIGASGKSLKLGTFAPPMAADWIQKWWKESKPAIYLYPEVDTTMSVRLNPRGQITVSDPLYSKEEGWKDFVAHPNGYLTYNGREYPHLFYEAELTPMKLPHTGDMVKGSELVTYFRRVLPLHGLVDREIEEFISYWMARLDSTQPYYWVHYLTNEQIEYLEPLTLSHQPDTSIRIRPYFKPLVLPIPITPQELPIVPQRTGFTVVEWGGILDE